MVENADFPNYDAQIVDPTPTFIVYSMNASLTIRKHFSVHVDPVKLDLFIDEGQPERAPYTSGALLPRR